MSMDPFADRKAASNERREHREAEEKVHLRNLMDSPSGRWILGRLIESFEKNVRNAPQDCAKDYRDLIVKHFGHTAIDHILKG